MAEANTTGSLTLKILIDRRNGRVLFAEAKKDFVDFIFHILDMPLGAVLRILLAESTASDHHQLGSLGSLYKGMKQLDAEYRDHEDRRQTNLLLPAVSSSSRLSSSYRCYTCGRCIGSYILSVNCRTCDGARDMTKCSDEEAVYAAVVLGSVRDYVKGLAPYMVMDDLVVQPMTSFSVFSVMNQFSIKDVAAIEKREVSFGIDEAVKLLKASVTSKTVLTDVFLAGAV